VLGGLQQERARAIGGKFAVGRQRGLGVGQDLAGHWNHTVLGRELAKFFSRRGGGEVGVHRTILADAPLNSGVT